MDRVGIALDFEKSSPDGSYVRGWAYVAKSHGVPVVDYSGQVTPMSVLREAAHDFISNSRISKVLHGDKEIGDVCEALVIDDDVVKALGMSTPHRGLFIGMKIHDAEVKKRIRSRELKQFSIGGKGRVVDDPTDAELAEAL